MAEAGTPQVKAGFDLSGEVLKDIDRKAAKEAKPSSARAKSGRLASVEKLIAKLPKS
jgi:hypothetical protein